MGARKPGIPPLKPGTAPLRRFARRWRFDRNPLRRATDRVETALLAVLVIAFLVGAPFAALAAGTWVHGIAERAQLAQQAARTQVTAVVLEVSTPPAGGDDLAWQARARWRAPDGREVTGVVPVSSDVPAGGTLQIWTNRNGGLVSAPLLASQVSGQTVLAEGTGVIATAVAATLAGALARRSLNKRRMAAWDADWHTTGPQWTTRS